MSLNTADSDYGAEGPGDLEEEYDAYDDRHAYCWLCGGRRWVITCPDDLCRGADECMHGDGHSNCPECNRDGKQDWELD
jgi:hypothetical protein